MSVGWRENQVEVEISTAYGNIDADTLQSTSQNYLGHNMVNYSIGPSYYFPHKYDLLGDSTIAPLLQLSTNRVLHIRWSC